MFKTPAVLNSEKHGNLKFKPDGGFRFSRNMHLVPVCVAEFYPAAREYPVVFVKNQEEFVPVVLTGLKENHNAFVNEAGFWNAQYVPATVRAYPFAFVDQDDEKSLVLIDEGYEGFNTSEGVALFDADKKLTRDLELKLDFLRQHKGQIAITREFVARMKEHGLFVERTAQVGNQQSPFQIAGVWVIDEKKLYELPDEVFLKFARQGYLALVTAHLMSLQSFGNVHQKEAENQPAVEEKAKKTTRKETV